MTDYAMPCTCVQGLLRHTLMTQMAGDPRMRTQGVHAPALEPGSAALRVAKRIVPSSIPLAFKLASVPLELSEELKRC